MQHTNLTCHAPRNAHHAPSIHEHLNGRAVERAPTPSSSCCRTPACSFPRGSRACTRRIRRQACSSPSRARGPRSSRRTPALQRAAVRSCSASQHGYHVVALQRVAARYNTAVQRVANNTPVQRAARATTGAISCGHGPRRQSGASQPPLSGSELPPSGRHFAALTVEPAAHQPQSYLKRVGGDCRETYRPSSKRILRCL